jgi:hypothetical protein
MDAGSVPKLVHGARCWAAGLSLIWQRFPDASLAVFLNDAPV